MASLASAGAALPRPLSSLLLGAGTQGEKKNVMIVVFDAFSASNVSVYGYGRETTPSLAVLAERAIVYHNHFAPATWTAPSTASLFTGVLPWTHRVWSLNQPLEDAQARHSIFHAFDGYYRIAYSHNPIPYKFLHQFRNALDELIPHHRLFLTTDGPVQRVFRADDDTSTVTWERAMGKDKPYGYSLFMSTIYKAWRARQALELREAFPGGLPLIRRDNYFSLETATDFLAARVHQIEQPFLAYFHLLPPHEPYVTSPVFQNHFAKDGFRPQRKPKGPFGGDPELRTHEILEAQRQKYDEYVLFVDQEFGRLARQLEDSGLLGRTWLVLTSDHGEFFERAILGHGNPALYQPVVRVPLIIFEPGRTSRLDIHAATSSIDLLPTMLHVTGREPANWSEGRVLPPFLEQRESGSRNVHAMHTRSKAPFAPLEDYSAMLVKGRHKLTFYRGYEVLEGEELVELFDIEDDPEELQNLYRERPELARVLLDELKTKLLEVDEPYR